MQLTRFYLYILGGCLLLSSCRQEPATTSQTETLNGSTAPFDQNQTEYPSQITFPGHSLPKGMSWKNSSISLDSKRYIWSDNSLRWDWKEEASITFNRPIELMGSWKARQKLGFSQPVENCFVVWIYNDTPRPQSHIRFSFGLGNEKACHFPFYLNFKGWRTAWVSYNRDMSGKPKPVMDYVKIEAPLGADHGTLWIGDIQVHQFIDHRHQHGDYQVPFVHGADKMTSGHWDPIMHWYDLAKKSNPPITLTDQYNAAFTKLRQFTQKTGKHSIDAKTVQRIEKKFAEYHITKSSGEIYGDHIFLHSQLAGAPDTSIRRNGHKLGSYLGFMRFLGNKYNSLNPTARQSAGGQRVAEIFCLLTEHLLDQGFDAGSSLGTMHHFGYDTRSWVPAISSMQEPLEQAGLLDRARESLAWFYNSNQMYAPAADWANMDYLNTLSQSDFYIQAMGTDGVDKAARLHQFSSWISEMLVSPSPGTKGGFKPDGSLFHHDMHYHGYGLPAINVVTNSIVRPLDGTPFEITTDAYNVLKRAFLAARFWCYPYSGFNACGRHPITGGIGSLKGSMRNLALSKPGTDEVDLELAAAYLRIYGGDSRKLFGKEIQPEKLHGFLTMNYNSSGTYTHGDSTAHIKGFGDGIRSHETYSNANRYGRYLSHGTIQVFKNNLTHRSGNEINGWDWCRLPGATTLLVPLDVLEGSTGFYGKVPKQKSYPSGAGSLGGNSGAFLFQLDPSPDPQSLRARKSVFAIDRTLICLGSGISNASKDYPTVTTLFQTAIPKENDLSAKGDGWLIDPHGTGYFLPKGSSIKHTQGTQRSRHSHSKKETTGNFSTAWIDHGTNPHKASYQYHILLDATPEDMQNWKASQQTSPTINVIQQNDLAHVITCPSKRFEATAAFDAYQAIGDTLLQATDRTCIVLLRSNKDKLLQVSVTDIDLPDVGTKPKSAETTITLKGTWSLRGNADIKATHQGHQTTLRIPTFRGASREFTLYRK